jgi:spore coat polysaccharide biosynthesis protein SpsF
VNRQLEAWAGRFGREYTDRNHVDWTTRVDGFKEMLAAADPVGSVLEIGCNRGHNLHAIQHLLPDAFVVGMEPNAYARDIATSSGFDVSSGNAHAIPYPNNVFDLVFTSGVLIHIHPDRLHDAMREITRVSRHFVLAVEYHADHDVELDYRGKPNMLWKRDYTKHYLEACDNLHLITTQPAPFDQATWVLLEKTIA